MRHTTPGDTYYSPDGTLRILAEGEQLPAGARVIKHQLYRLRLPLADSSSFSSALLDYRLDRREIIMNNRLPKPRKPRQTKAKEPPADDKDPATTSDHPNTDAS